MLFTLDTVDLGRETTPIPGSFSKNPLRGQRIYKPLQSLEKYQLAWLKPRMRKRESILDATTLTKGLDSKAPRTRDGYERYGTIREGDT